MPSFGLHVIRMSCTVLVSDQGHFRLCLLARPDTPAMVAALFCFSLRLVTAIYFQKKMTGRFFLRYLPVTPIKDLLQVVLWVLAFSGNRVNWRGEKLRALARGKLARG